MKEFIFFKKSIDESTIDRESGIRQDELGLCAGGWFVTESEYPNSTEIISFNNFLKEATIEDRDGSIYYCWSESND